MQRDFRIDVPIRDDPERYLRAVRSLPRPTPAQVSNFVDYVASAHSWYKHLPFLPPGREFVFFLDPHAGCDRIVQRTGTVTHRKRTDDTPERQRFHYTWQPTDQYVAKFGHLNYDADAGTSFRVGHPDGVLTTKSVLAIESQPREWLAVPPIVRQAGSTFVTCTVHPLGDITRALFLHATAGTFNRWDVIHAIRRIPKDGFLWVRLLWMRARSRPMPVTALVSAICEFAAAADPAFASDEASMKELSQQAHRWVLDTRRANWRNRRGPTWLRGDWLRTDRQRNLKRIRAAVEFMLSVVYDDQFPPDERPA